LAEEISTAGFTARDYFIGLYVDIDQEN